MASIKSRIKSLEAKAKAKLPTVMALNDEEVKVKIGEVLRELRARFDEEERQYAALDTVGRILHWQAKIQEAHETIRTKGHDPRDEEATRKGAMGMEVWPGLRVAGAKQGLHTEGWHLLDAQLARLAELGYDSPELEPVRREHDRWRGLEYQWRGPALPDKALRFIEEYDPSG